MAEEEETIGDVLSRTSGLNKDEMTTEVESYGLEVDPSWTKAEIMDNFELFLTSPEESVPEESVPEPEPEPQPEPAPIVPPVPGPPPTPPNPPQTPNPNVRITASQSWGAGAKAP